MTSAPIRTRTATLADAAAIAAIYNEGIADRIATFETEPRKPEQIATLLADKGDRYPTVVAEREEQIVAGPAPARTGAVRPTPAWPSIRSMSPGPLAAPASAA